MCSSFFIFIGVFLLDGFVVTAGKYNTIAVTKQALSTSFVPKITGKMCLLKPDRGPCRGNIVSYYFDPKDMSCSTFEWGGCQGNGNRFDTKSECEKICLTRRNSPKAQPRYCQLTFDYGFCFGDMKRWYYDRMWKVCKEAIYSGCGGNKNNFYNKEQCDSICTFAKGAIKSIKKKNEGNRKVIYVYTNITHVTKTTRDMSVTRFTSPGPRYGRN